MTVRPGLSLFWRIFLLIWLAMAAALLLNNLVDRQLVNYERQKLEQQPELSALAAEAVRIQQDEGRGATWRYLREQGEQRGLQLLLVPPGRDADMPRHMRERRTERGLMRPATIDAPDDFQLIVWPHQDHQGWAGYARGRVLQWTLAFVIISLACWWIARRISRPLRLMENTAQAIAAGQNQLRVTPDVAGRGDEVGATARAFNAMTDQLCALLARQQQLLRDISHDLRTPLARQRVAIELAADTGADEELMASILRQNERLEAMTTQVLTLYRLSESRQTMRREPVNMTELVNRSLQDAADYAIAQQVECHLTVAPDARQLTVLGDADLLQRALDNILQNALDHTPPGQDVNLTLRLEGKDVYLALQDSGPGVPDAVLGQLFEPFFRADQSRGGQGWGLGLAIAKDVVQAHDGDINALNRTEGGLRVVFRLPVFTGLD